MTNPRGMVAVLYRSKLVTEPDGPYAQHDGQFVMPTVDLNGNQWVTLAVGDGAGAGNTAILEVGADDADNRPNFSIALNPGAGLAVVNHPYLFDGGTTWDRQRNASATNLALLSGTGAGLKTGPGEWAVTHTPAAGAQATITRAAGAAGVAHVCKGISFTFSAVAAEAGTILVNLRDGASGAGTILQSWRVGPFALNGSLVFGLSDLNIIGSAATAMTLEFAAAGAGTNFESVALRGFDAS